jgi:type I restriction enzyme S subunit
MQKIANGVSVYGISKTAVSKIKLPLPSLPEQNRIVSVLETWDKAIEKLSEKIEIKKQIKKGLMQNLLTGKKRLSGFTDKWKSVNLGETCKYIKTGKLDANAMVENGKYRFYTCAKDYYFIDDYAFDTEALLVSGNGANVGYVHYYKGKFNAYQRTYVLYDFTENILFIKYLLDLFLKNRIKEEVREGNTPYITMDTLTEMNLKVPTVQEQQVIVNILDTADKEITELEKKLSIIKEQKRYLLNNLITGTIRTPETLSTKVTQ